MDTSNLPGKSFEIIIQVLAHEFHQLFLKVWGYLFTLLVRYR